MTLLEVGLHILEDRGSTVSVYEGADLSVTQDISTGTDAERGRQRSSRGGGGGRCGRRGHSRRWSERRSRHLCSGGGGGEGPRLPEPDQHGYSR